MTKLYKVLITYEAMVLAEDQEKAQGFTAAILDSEVPTVQAWAINPFYVYPPLNWTADTLIYNDLDQDITLRSAMKQAQEQYNEERRQATVTFNRDINLSRPATRGRVRGRGQR